jgi:DnaJ domain
VQPDAPPEVIRAAYRALIVLHHPDAGGSHEQAVLINAAWDVLGNPDARARYDATLPPRRGVPVWPATASTPPEPGPLTRCLFCQTGVAAGATRCPRCQAPLTRVAPTPRPRDNAASPDERRRLRRIDRADWGRLFLAPTDDALDVRLRDLSLEGVSFYSGQPLTVGRRVRVTALRFDAMLDIVGCWSRANIWVISGRFVTVDLSGTL